MDLALFESGDGVWRVESILLDGQHRYRISRDGAIYADVASLAPVHGVLLDNATIDAVVLGLDHTSFTGPGPNGGEP